MAVSKFVGAAAGQGKNVVDALREAIGPKHAEVDLFAATGTSCPVTIEKNVKHDDIAVSPTSKPRPPRVVVRSAAIVPRRIEYPPLSPKLTLVVHVADRLRSNRPIAADLRAHRAGAISVTLLALVEGSDGVGRAPLS